MLIELPEHSKRNLEIWRNLERTDTVWSKSSKFQNRVDETLRYLETFKDEEEIYIAVSWGKDSVTMLDLCLRAGLEFPTVHVVHDPIYNPYSLLVRRKMFDTHNFDYVEVVQNCMEANSDKLSASLIRKHFGERSLLGLRAQESSARRISSAVHGAETKYTIRPLLKWTLQDVFSYLASRDLPAHPVYGFLDSPKDREFIRVGVVGGPEGRNFSREELEKKVYTESLNMVRYYLEKCIQ